ncbi:hypothetical protein AB5J62_28005 [Amycolatopsis sp. cg5]|uniref:hypothetical protein n=1 Tax=Amycolatopsis sp. cg5 TaxID=3238802 RepID=UPI0035259D97
MTVVSRVVALILTIACVAACSGPTPTPPYWQRIEDPAPGAKVRALITDGHVLYAFGSAGHAPAAWAGRPWRAVPVQPRSGYGRQADLTLPSLSGDRLFALGEAFGGAHGNPRPTIWAGSAAGLTEYPQGVELLGGPRGITTSGSAAGPDAFLLTGQWDHARGGPGAAVWLSPDGVTWAQQEDPALLSEPGAQTRILGAGHDGREFVAVGDVSVNEPGRAKATPLAWTSADGKTWRREPLADPDSLGNTSVARVTCSPESCVAVGVTSRPGGVQRLVSWVRTATWGQPSVAAVDVPADQLLEVTGLTARMVTAKAGGRPRLWSLDGKEMPLPEESDSVSAASLGRDDFLATTRGDVTHLWTRPVTP